MRLRTRRRRCKKTENTSVYRPRLYLLTRNETEFFHVLIAALGNRYLVSCKVRLADIITCADREWERAQGNRIKSKHVDFVLSCPFTSHIVAAIELDDKSHEKPERRRRDDFVNRLFSQMRIPLLRFATRWRYDATQVAEVLTGAGLD